MTAGRPIPYRPERAEQEAAAFEKRVTAGIAEGLARHGIHAEPPPATAPAPW